MATIRHDATAIAHSFGYGVPGIPTPAPRARARAAAPLLHVLQHALGRNQYGKNNSVRPDHRSHFCAGPGHADFVTCRDAVAAGLMLEHPPSEISGGDHIFVVTDAGRAYLAANSPPEPKRSRAQERYQRFLHEDGSLSFGEWLRTQGRR